MLSRYYRLKRSGLLTKCFKAGRRLNRQCPYLDIVALPKIKEPSHPRFCFVVSKKVSNKAVHRNKIRRRLAALFRDVLAHEGPSRDRLAAYSAVIIIAKPEVLNLPYTALEAAVRKSLNC